MSDELKTRDYLLIAPLWSTDFLNKRNQHASDFNKLIVVGCIDILSNVVQITRELQVAVDFTD